MAASRISLALAETALASSARIALVEPQADLDLSALPADPLTIVSRHATIHTHFSRLDCQTEIPLAQDLVLISVPREKAFAQSLIANACATSPEGLILVDGQKTDGIDALYKACRTRVDILAQLTKSHGRAFWFRATSAFEDWKAVPKNFDGFQTRPGVFSADGIDPASAMLARHLPEKPGPIVADLGAGWGYLGHEMLARDQVRALHLVENDRIALDCAKRNLTDPRAVFHWADATTWRAPEPLDLVIMNPPFHQGRKGLPALGQAFILAAARNLKPGGQLLLVANRHLPYEATLTETFEQVDVLDGSRSFKILRATRPTRRGR